MDMREKTIATLLIVSIALNLVLSIYIIQDYDRRQYELDELSDLRMIKAEGDTVIYFYRYNLGQVDEKVLEAIGNKFPTTIDSEGNVWIYFNVEETE